MRSATPCQFPVYVSPVGGGYTIEIVEPLGKNAAATLQRLGYKKPSGNDELYLSLREAFQQLSYGVSIVG